jgi:putative endonuclease
MKTTRQKLGRWGEDLAADYLATKGYTIVDRNARTPYGEIDLVAQREDEGDCVTIFVEVKTRSSTAFGLPEEAVNRRKQEHMLNSALHYLQEHPERGQHWRCDVIAIQRVRGGTPQITLFENAFGNQE